MKRFLLFLLSILAVLPFAIARDYNRSAVKVRLSDRSPLAVTIDGRDYQKHGRTIIVADLPAGRHSIKVYKYYAYRDREGGRGKLVYEGIIRTYKGMVTDCSVDPERAVMKVKRYEINDYERNDNYKDYDDYSKPEYKERDSYERTYSRLEHEDMHDLETRVKDRITDTEKLKLMKSVLEPYSYTTRQVQEMMGWLSFESSMLDFAKWAYNGVIDKQDYWKLESEFDFSSSKEELQGYINNRR